MLLHINSNYIYSALHAQMLGHMPDQEKHLVFCPVVKGAQISPTLTEKEKTDPRLFIRECFYEQDRFFYSYKRKKIYRALQEAVDLSKIDLVHAYTLFTDGDIAYRLKKDRDIPYVVVIRNSDVNTFFKFILHKRSHGLDILREAGAVFFLSKSYRNRLLASYIPAEDQEAILAKSYVVPNGINDFFHLHPPWGEGQAGAEVPPGSVHRLLFVGQINRNKNISAIQKARAVLAQRGVETELAMVGRILNPWLFRRLLRSPGTHYLGPKKKEELLEPYRQAEVFVMPSLTESFGLVYAEALSQGLPVIYTRDEGFDGQFPDGQVGFAVDPRDPEDIADAIQKVLADPDMPKRALAAGANFRWETIDQRYLEIYDRVRNQ